MLNSAMAYLLDEALILSGDTVIIAVSGGADSVALLLLAQECSKVRKFNIIGAHVEHGIRGSASLEDMEFVKCLCAKLCVPLEIIQVDVPKLAQENSQGIEQTARDVRYSFFHELRLKYHAKYILLGHHKLDQAETVLMHLFRGSGMNGLGGMQPVSEYIMRPLLHETPQDIRAYLTQVGQAWKEDHTNSDVSYTRNQIRLGVIPQIELAYRGGVNAIVKAADIIASDNNYLDTIASSWFHDRLHSYPMGYYIDCNSSDIPHIGIIRRVLVKLLQTSGLKDFSMDTVERLRNMLGISGGKVQIDGVRYAIRSSSRLYLISDGFSFADVPFVDGARFASIGRFKTYITHNGNYSDDETMQLLAGDAMAHAVLRQRKAGDVITPLGMVGTCKLSDYFIDRKVDSAIRDCLPIIAVGSNVLWAVGVGISRDASITQSTKSFLRVQFIWECDKLWPNNK